MVTYLMLYVAYSDPKVTYANPQLPKVTKFNVSSWQRLNF